MRVYQKGGEEKNRLIDYTTFVNALRLPLTGRRLEIVKQAYGQIGGGSPDVTVGQAKAAFAYEEFDKFCELMGVPAGDEGAAITWEAFQEFYADISMASFDDKAFIRLVENTWMVMEPAEASVTKEQIQALVTAIRANLLKAGSERHTEEFILRELFREHDRNADGTLSKVELRAMLGKLDLNASDKYLDALLCQMDSNKNGVIEFEEFLSFLVQARYTKH